MKIPGLESTYIEWEVTYIKWEVTPHLICFNANGISQKTYSETLCTFTTAPFLIKKRSLIVQI
jgi:hypothetical protein